LNITTVQDFNNYEASLIGGSININTGWSFRVNKRVIYFEHSFYPNGDHNFYIKYPHLNDYGEIMTTDGDLSISAGWGMEINGTDIFVRGNSAIKNREDSRLGEIKGYRRWKAEVYNSDKSGDEEWVL
jgi:hypothetical protein